MKPEIREVYGEALVPALIKIKAAEAAGIGSVFAAETSRKGAIVARAPAGGPSGLPEA